MIFYIQTSRVWDSDLFYIFSALAFVSLLNLYLSIDWFSLIFRQLYMVFYILEPQNATLKELSKALLSFSQLILLIFILFLYVHTINCDVFLASLDRILLQITHCYLSLYYQIQLQNNSVYEELYFWVKRVVSSFWSPYLGNYFYSHHLIYYRYCWFQYYFLKFIQ